MTVFGFAKSTSASTNAQQVPIDEISTTGSSSQIPVAVPINNENQQQNNSKELGLSSEAQYNIISSSDKTIKVNATIVAPVEISEDKREALDLVCVLDISSSMNGKSKLQLCKNTLDFMVSQLGPSDRLSLVTFSNSANTVQGLTKMDESGKTIFRNNVKRVRASGMTNLSGGLLKGVSEIMSDREDGEQPNPIQSILLLTDGQANMGIKDKDMLIDFLRSSHQDETVGEEDKKTVTLPYSIFTFGFGTDHNVELLKGLSDVANGVYYFIDDLDKVGNAFGDCLGGLLSIVTQNTTLEIVGTESTKVGDLYTDYPSRRKNNSISVELGDLYAEEQRNVLSSFDLKFTPSMFQDRESDAQIEICKLRLSAMNLQLKKMEKKELSVFVRVRQNSKDLKTSEKQENMAVAIHYNRWETSKTLKEADKISDDPSKSNHAIDLLHSRQKCLKNLQEQSSSSSVINERDMALLSEMQMDIDECVFTMKNMSTNDKMKKKGFMMNKMNKLGRERGNSFTNYEENDDMLSASLSLEPQTASRKTRSVYETSAKQISKSRASKW